MGLAIKMNARRVMLSCGLGGAALAFAIVSGCGPKVPAAPAVAFDRTVAPEPLATRPFALPEVQETTLSNGLRVLLVESHEVPLVYVRVVFDQGSWTDPEGQRGLAGVTMEMLKEGAGDRSAEELSSALRALASSMSTGAGLDSAEISVRSLKKNLESTLDLMADVLFQPAFSEDGWEVMQQRKIQDLAAARDNPRSISSRVWERTIYGETYAGRLRTEAGYQQMNIDQMKTWKNSHLLPQNAIVLVGGDTTLDTIKPMLEKRLGGWVADPVESAAAPDVSALPAHDQTILYLVDKPGAPQTVIRGGIQIGDRTDEDWPALVLANRAIGGQFTARINLNLREDKGWTYGARSYISHNQLPGYWVVSTSVVTEHTAASMREILAEVKGAASDRPLTKAELDAARNGLLGTWPLSFENPGYILGERKSMWRYDLPQDWLTGYPDRIREVNLEQSQQAWNQHIDAEKLVFVLVGDAATIGPGLEELGLAIVHLDVDGNPLESEGE